MKPIPDTLAQQLAHQYGYDVVIIYAKKFGQGEYVASGGTTGATAVAASYIGTRLRKLFTVEASRGTDQ